MHQGVRNIQEKSLVRLDPQRRLAKMAFPAWAMELLNYWAVIKQRNILGRYPKSLVHVWANRKILSLLSWALVKLLLLLVLIFHFLVTACNICNVLTIEQVKRKDSYEILAQESFWIIKYQAISHELNSHQWWSSCLNFVFYSISNLQPYTCKLVPDLMRSYQD